MRRKGDYLSIGEHYPFLLFQLDQDQVLPGAITDEPRHWVGGGLCRPPSAHRTVRTGPYTAPHADI